MISPPGSLLGAERPRVELRPLAAVDTYGPEACELAVRAGLPLEDWQADGLHLMLSCQEDGRWAAREYAELVGRQQGKSVGVGVPRALAGLLLLGERLIMWSAHEVKTALEAHLQIRLALEQLGEPAGPNLIALDDDGTGGELLVKVVNNNGYEGFTTSDGRRMRFVARSKSSGRGFSGDCNIIDEAFAYTRAQQSALAPTQLARPNPQTVYLSSPPLRGDTDEGAVLFALAERAEKADPAERLGFRDWGLAKTLDDVAAMRPEKREAFLDDRRNWEAALPALGRGRVTAESIEQLRREMDDLDFAREVLGCWPVRAAAGRWTVIRELAWRARGGLESQRPDEAITFGLDASWPAAEMGAITVAGRLGEEVTVQVVEHRPGTGWMVRRAVELDQDHADAVFVLDPKGPAGHLLPELEEAGLEMMTPGAGDIARGFGRFVAEVTGDEPSLRHYDQKELDDALRIAGKRKLGDGFEWARQGDGDISTLTAATVALIGVFEGGLVPWAEYG